MSALKTRLQLLWESSGLKSLRDFDRQAKAPRGLTAMILSGSRDGMHPATAKKYAARYGCSWLWLYDGSGRPPRFGKRVA